LTVEASDAITIVELEKDLPDEAKLALLDLDFTGVAMNGRRLRWSAQAQAWEPTDKQS
jgi:hypothetical protein